MQDLTDLKTDNGISRKTISESLYLAKGVAILLVVVGHFGVAGEPFYWSYFRGPIYAFHMALFMLLSGYLFGMSNEKFHSSSEYLGFIKKKFERLMYPYISVTILFLLVKYPAGRFFHLTYPVDGDALYYIFLNPTGGFSYMLWFIYTLFIIFVIFSFFRNVFKSDWLVFGVSVLLSFLPWPEYLCLNLVFGFLPIFAVGYIIAVRGFLMAIAPEAGFMVFLVFFIALYLPGNKLAGSSPYALQALFELRGFAGSMTVVYLCVSMVRRKFFFTGVLKSLGVYSSSIYFLHTITMSSLTIFVTQVMGVKTIYSLLAILIIAAGMVVPVLIDKYLIQRSVLAGQWILGRKTAAPSRSVQGVVCHKEGRVS